MFCLQYNTTHSPKECKTLTHSLGEWQTQLSRQQMRALRQKKQQQTQETGSSTPSKPITVDNSGSEEHTEENKSGGPAASEKTSYTKGGRRGKAKKQRDKDSGKSQEPPANKTVGKTADSEGMPDLVVVRRSCFIVFHCEYKFLLLYIYQNFIVSSFMLLVNKWSEMQSH